MANTIQTKMAPPVQPRASIGTSSMASSHPAKIDIELLQGADIPACVGDLKASPRAGGWSRIDEEWLQIEKTMARNESCRMEMQRVMTPARAALPLPLARG